MKPRNQSCPKVDVSFPAPIFAARSIRMRRPGAARVRPRSERGDGEHRDALVAYYAAAFPFDALYTWLGASSRRELSMTLPGGEYVRRLAYGDAGAWKADALDRVPVKMDAGAIYGARPAKTGPGADAKLRELVFDIDATDYDVVRTCCSGAAMCRACWPLVQGSCQLLDARLRAEFGYTRVVWVFSGRRGAHAWVGDAQAVRLTNGQRSAVAKRLGGPLPVMAMAAPSVARVYTEHVIPLFAGPFLEGQGWIGGSDTAQWPRLLRRIECGRARTAVRTAWLEAEPRSQGDLTAQRWAAFVEHAGADAVRRVVMHHMGPRLDAAVTAKRNHLLKLPFVAHPSTKRICMPFDPCSDPPFDPWSVPRLGDVAGAALSSPSPSGPCPAAERVAAAAAAFLCPARAGE